MMVEAPAVRGEPESLSNISCLYQFPTRTKIYFTGIVPAIKVEALDIYRGSQRSVDLSEFYAKLLNANK